MIWVVLALWWAVYPAIPEFVGAHWLVHMGAVGLAGLCVAPRLWRASRLRLSWPAVAALLAMASLLVSMHIQGDRFPLADRWWAGLTGLAHGLFFLLALSLVPPGDDTGDVGAAPEEDAGTRTVRQALLVIFLGLLVAQLAVVVRSEQDVARVAGGFRNPNVFGALVFATGLAVAAFGRWKPWGLVALAVLVLLVILTRSRGAAAAGSAVLLIFVARRHWTWVLGLSALMVAGLVFIPNPLWERVLQIENDHQFSRTYIWQAALENIVEHPLGIGPGMNRLVFPEDAFQVERPWLLHQRHTVGLTHNVLLTLTLEWGWLAGAAGLGLAAWTLRRLLRRHPPDALAQGATLGALVLFLELQIDGLEQNPVVFAIFLFLAAVVMRRRGGQPSGPAVSGRVVAVLLVLASVFLLSQVGVRGHTFKTAREAQATWKAFLLRQADEADVREALRVAEEAAPRDATLSLARFQFERELLVRAVRRGEPQELIAEFSARMWAAMARARTLDPADSELPREEVEVALWELNNAGIGEPARRRYLQAVRDVLVLDPLDVRTLRQLAREEAGLKRYDRMEQVFARLFSLEPDDALSWVILGRFRILQGNMEGGLYAYVRAREAVFNARIKAGYDNPRSKAYYEDVLSKVDLKAISSRIAELRRELFL